MENEQIEVRLISSSPKYNVPCVTRVQFCSETFTCYLAKLLTNDCAASQMLLAYTAVLCL